MVLSRGSVKTLGSCGIPPCSSKDALSWPSSVLARRLQSPFKAPSRTEAFSSASQGSDTRSCGARQNEEMRALT